MDANSRREEFKEKLIQAIIKNGKMDLFNRVKEYKVGLNWLTFGRECTIYKNCTECQKHQECLKEVFSDEEMALSILKECKEMVVETPAETTKAKIEMRRD